MDSNNYLIIDLSYYNFYRFFATKQWYTRANPDDKFEVDYDWSINELFWEKFKKMFIDNIKKYVKKLKINWKRVIFARDCSRKDIWRNVFYPDYKANREELYNKTQFQGGKVFKRCYSEIIPELIKEYRCVELQVPQCEADDVIYMSVNYVNNRKVKPSNIYVVSSDHDLLQILDENPNVTLIDAKMNSYNDKSKGSYSDNVYMKAILGDSSDNIPQAFKKVGERTAKKLLNDMNMMLAKIRGMKTDFELLCRNKLLVDFKYIPIQFREYFEVIAEGKI